MGFCFVRMSLRNSSNPYFTEQNSNNAYKKTQTKTKTKVNLHYRRNCHFYAWPLVGAVFWDHSERVQVRSHFPSPNVVSVLNPPPKKKTRNFSLTEMEKRWFPAGCCRGNGDNRGLCIETRCLGGSFHSQLLVSSVP